MNKPDIFTVQSRLRPFSPKFKLKHLKKLIDEEKPRSIRRAQLVALSKRIRLAALEDFNKCQRRKKRQLRKEIRQDNVRKAS